MTLRELVQKAGGINSPTMDYEIRIWSSNRKITAKDCQVDLNKVDIGADGKIYLNAEALEVKQ